MPRDLFADLPQQTAVEPRDLLAQSGITLNDPDIPTPTPPAELAAQAAALENRPMLEKIGENIRQNTMMGGATDIMNVLSSAPPTAAAGTGAIPAAISEVARRTTGALPSVTAGTRAAGQAAGYVVPASQSGRPAVLGRIIEGMAGKQNVQQAASMKNQAVTNRIAAQELGLPADTALTPTVLKNVRREAGKAYAQVAKAGVIKADNQYLHDLVAIRDRFAPAAMDFPGAAKTDIFKDLRGIAQEKFGADAAVGMIRQLRDKASTAFRAGNGSEGQAFKEMASALESQLERHLARTGAQNLDEYRRARQIIAKTHDIEDALNAGTADVKASRIAAAEPPSGGLKTVADFREAFPKATQDPSLYGSQPLFNLADMVAGAAGGAWLGPQGIALGAARPIARNVLGRLALAGQPMDTQLKMQALVAAIRAAMGGKSAYDERIGELSNAQSP